MFLYLNMKLYMCIAQDIIKTRSYVVRSNADPNDICDRRFLQDRVFLQEQHANRKGIREVKFAWRSSKKLPEQESALTGAKFRKTKFLSMYEKYVFGCFKHVLKVYKCIARSSFSPRACAHCRSN